MRRYSALQPHLQHEAVGLHTERTLSEGHSFDWGVGAEPAGAAAEERRRRTAAGPRPAQIVWPATTAQQLLPDASQAACSDLQSLEAEWARRRRSVKDRLGQDEERAERAEAKLESKYIHSAGIIHRDLKPGNLAVNPDCELKILDFGLARQADTEMTGYVVTRWYRAPEVILNWMHYTQTVDIWSVGCIMAEMLLGKPLFKGNDHLDQLKEIMKVTGTPAADFVVKLQSQDAKNYIRSLPKIPKIDMHTIFSKASSNAVGMLERMLLLDPEARVSAAEALATPFVSEFREPEEETEALPYDHSMDNTDLPVDQWKRHTFTEILTFSPLRDSKETSL
ncbi:unnamed protein product [Boreogadus saida]